MQYPLNAKLLIEDYSLPVFQKLRLFDTCTKQSRPYYSLIQKQTVTLKVDMPILTCICFTFVWLTLTSEIHFVKFHPEVASCLLSRGKRKYVRLGMRLLWKYIRNYFLVYHLISHFLLYCNQKNMGFHLISKNILLPVEPLGMRMWSV